MRQVAFSDLRLVYRKREVDGVVIMCPEGVKRKRGGRHGVRHGVRKWCRGRRMCR